MGFLGVTRDSHRAGYLLGNSGLSTKEKGGCGGEGRVGDGVVLHS